MAVDSVVGKTRSALFGDELDRDCHLHGDRRAVLTGWLELPFLKRLGGELVEGLIARLDDVGRSDVALFIDHALHHHETGYAVLLHLARILRRDGADRYRILATGRGG